MHHVVIFVRKQSSTPTIPNDNKTIRSSMLSMTTSRVHILPDTPPAEVIDLDEDELVLERLQRQPHGLKRKHREKSPPTAEDVGRKQRSRATEMGASLRNGDGLATKRMKVETVRRSLCSLWSQFALCGKVFYSNEEEVFHGSTYCQSLAPFRVRVRVTVWRNVHRTGQEGMIGVMESLHPELTLCGDHFKAQFFLQEQLNEVHKL
ncbi:hypothetical protein BT69DRAFT_522286 [Atractiella rhizophila]|nr:hypothetical protein BT69DRAFT_522286 [Atractiella rhizophila]